jgi:hypothetical protein
MIPSPSASLILLIFLSFDPQDSDSDDDAESDDDDSVNWDQSSSSSSSDSDSDDGGVGELKGRARWLKRTTVVKEKVEKDKAGRAEERKKAKEAAAQAKAAAEQAAKDAKNLDLDDANLTPSLIQKRTLEIVASRGRKGVNNQELLKQLEALSKLSVRFGPRVEIPLLMHVITAQFDLQRTIDDYMETTSWRSCASYLSRIGSILDNGEGWKIGALTGEEEDLANDLMITAAMGKGGGKMKKTGGFGDGAISALSTEEKLINPHTVSNPSCLSYLLSILPLTLKFFDLRVRSRLKMNALNVSGSKRRPRCQQTNSRQFVSPALCPFSCHVWMKNTTSLYKEYLLTQLTML